MNLDNGKVKQPVYRSILVTSCMGIAGTFDGEEREDGSFDFIDAPELPQHDKTIQTAMLGTDGAKEAYELRKLQLDEPVRLVEVYESESSDLPMYTMDDDPMKVFGCFCCGGNIALTVCILLSAQPSKYLDLIAKFDNQHELNIAEQRELNRVNNIAALWPFRVLQSASKQFLAIEQFILTGDASAFTKENGFAQVWLAQLNEYMDAYKARGDEDFEPDARAYFAKVPGEIGEQLRYFFNLVPYEKIKDFDIGHMLSGEYYPFTFQEYLHLALTLRDEKERLEKLVDFYKKYRAS